MTKSQYSDQFAFDIHQQICLDVRNIEDEGNMFSVKIDIMFLANNIIDKSSITARLSFDESIPKLLNSIDLIDSINSIIDRCRLEVADKLVEKSHPTTRDSINLDDYYNPNMFVPEPLFQSIIYTVPRFKKNVSLDLWDKVILARPFDMMGVGIYNDNYDFINGGAILSDQNWAQVIAVGSGTQGDWHSVTGGLGNGPYEFRNPMGIEFIPPSGFIVADTYNNRALIYQVDLNSGNFTFIDSLSNNYNYVADVASAYIHGNPNRRQVAVLDQRNNRVDLYDVASDHTATHLYSLFSDKSDRFSSVINSVTKGRYSSK